MPDAAGQLIIEMQPGVESCDDTQLAARYRAAIDAVGPVPLLAEIFRRFEDATLKGWLLCLSFVWEDLPFAAWKEILYRISDDDSAVYQFVPFATEFLAIDIAAVIRDDPAVHPSARIFTARQFPKGGPPPGSDWVRQVLLDHGIEVHRLWRRLAAEGAPMRTR